MKFEYVKVHENSVESIHIVTVAIEGKVTWPLKVSQITTKYSQLWYELIES